ncbi:hypothetical protein AQUCO_02000548v1 [Aquilegia coerulea]|uniref:Uncharacterized protein n=1 Tax=Aquilegia coerulea TaxID=218851 RepID=A0A2G5DI42_AQUCA|nr:hypothetical protein AQUCO_02000548v1 [Aquilegia coerulea]
MKYMVQNIMRMCRLVRMAQCLQSVKVRCLPKKHLHPHPDKTPPRSEEGKNSFLEESLTSLDMSKTLCIAEGQHREFLLDVMSKISCNSVMCFARDYPYG